MVSLKNFRKLDSEIQLHCLYGSGVNLELYLSLPEEEVVLYSLYDFYVEIYFDKYISKVTKLRSFKNMNLVKPYLKQVDISEIEELLRRIDNSYPG